MLNRSLKFQILIANSNGSFPSAVQMNASNVRHDEAFDRLQNLLTRLSAGDRLSAAEAARQSGLNEDTCRTVLERLVHVGLMSCEGRDGFVRRHMDSS